MSRMNADTEGRSIRLADGRALGYAEYGDPGGRPIFDFHGNPSSRLGSKLLEEAARQVGARVIGVDRPGIGLSDHKPDRKLLDWPDDVTQLADALGIDRFAAMGGSGGGPAALACAFKIPSRLIPTGVLFGPRPLGAWGATAGWSAPMRIQAFVGRHGPLGIIDLIMKALSLAMERNAGEAMANMARNLPEPDREAFARPGVRELGIATIREAFRSGSRGAALDYALSMRPWGFRLEDIRTPVHLWHGEADTTVPPAMGRYLASAIPNCRPRFLANEGHYSLIPNHAAEILETLLAAGASEQPFHAGHAGELRAGGVAESA
jgi:pimeloyl-ACP methyl ester carboxylesterase